MTRPLRLLVYDRTCTRELGAVGLSTPWKVGAALYRKLGRLDAAFGASSWEEALAWLATHEAPRPVGEIQYWGHGKWGSALIAGAPFDAGALGDGHRLVSGARAVRERLVPGGEALVWLRTCESFGARAGLDFAARLADFFGARVAGHTFVIGALQSGLHGLLPGSTPHWPLAEGLAEGTPESPRRAYGSGPKRPNTITCFDGRVPEAWFSPPVR